MSNISYVGNGNENGKLIYSLNIVVLLWYSIND